MRGILKRISFFVVLGAALWLAPGCGEEKTLPKPVPVMTALEPIEVSSGQTARIAFSSAMACACSASFGALPCQPALFSI